MTSVPDTTLMQTLGVFFASRGVDVFVVGGTVRNRLLGRDADADIDLAVRGDAVELGKQLATSLGASLAPLGVPRGMMRVVLPDDAGAGFDGVDHGRIIDLSGYPEDIESDLSRRDFTVNAMAVRLSEWEEGDFGSAVIDPFGGRADLVKKTIRAFDEGVFEDDPGRLLRAVRLSGELRMRIDPDTVRKISEQAGSVRLVSPPRLRDEFLRILAPNGARGRLEAMDHLGLLEHIVPELKATKGVDQPKMHYWDVWGHTLHTVEAAEGVTGGHQNSPIYSCVPWTPVSEAYFAEKVSDGHTRRTILKVAALFHDIAKPQTKTLEPDGRTRFFGHSEQGAEVAAARLESLAFSNRGISIVSRLVLHHLRPTNMSEKDEWPTNRAIYRYFKDTGEVAVDTLFLCLADYLGAKGPELEHPQWLEHAKMITHVLYTGTQEPVAVTTARLITGHDLMSQFQLQPGPHIGSLLEVIEEARAAGEIETQEQALELAAATLKRQGYPRDGSRACSV